MWMNVEKLMGLSYKNRHTTARWTEEQNEQYINQECDTTVTHIPARAVINQEPQRN